MRRISLIPFQSCRFFAVPPDAPETAKIFEQIVYRRFAARNFVFKPTPDPILENILELTQRAPSSVNFQPYKCVVVKSDEAKQKLSTAMLGSNEDKVKSASFILVLASDQKPSKSIKDFLELERKTKRFSEDVLMFRKSTIGYIAVESSLKAAAFKVITSVIGLFKPVPRPIPSKTWAYKNTMLAAENFMLACASYDIDTCPMEGFDENRVKKFLQIPSRYSIPTIIVAGYSSTKPNPPSERYPVNKTFFEDYFGTPIKF